MSDLTGQTALVTGASRGIGRAIAERLVAEGARVAVHYATNQAAASEVVASIERAGGSAFAVHAEFGLNGVESDVEALFAGLEAGLGGQPLDILVNNAAILDTTPFDEVTADGFDRSFQVNVRAPFFIIQRALPLIRDGGRIINVSSVVTRVAGPFVPYAMSKGAIEVLGRTLAQHLGRRRITVNSVAPGVVETDLGAWVDSDPEIRPAIVATTALGRLGQTTDIADVVAFLASDRARWITGHSREASGGSWLGPAA
jgi:3-oxoacyl-[acyl-carrier protein] reductase